MITDTLPDGGAPPPATPPPGNIVPLDTRQYVTFHVQDGIFAVPLAEVEEIIRMPALVQVPLSPASLEGLANLRGAVMSITSLRRIFRFPDLSHDDSTRVVVINHGVPVGLVVDRMAAGVTAESDQIESTASIQSTINTDLLRGMIKGADGKPMIMILDPISLIEGEFGGIRKQRSNAGGHDAAALSEQETDASDELQLVSFEVAHQEYALPIENVQEIVQVPQRINQIPKADPHVLGVVTLRDRLLPLVSLREMFNLDRTPLDERNKIVVVPLPDRTSVGIVMDMVKEVLRVNRNLLDHVPRLLKRGDAESEITGICRLDGGKRLVSVLSADALFSNAIVRRAIDAAGQDADKENGMDAHDTTVHGVLEEEEQFVVFRLAHLIHRLGGSDRC